MIDLFEIVNKYIDVTVEKPFVGTDNRYHYVYITINRINGKFYIGKRTESALSNSYRGSGKVFKLAKKKYHAKNFIKFPIKFFATSIQAFEYEKLVLTQQIIDTKDSYNMTIGGWGYSSENNPSHLASINGTFWNNKISVGLRKLSLEGRHPSQNRSEQCIKTITESARRTQMVKLEAGTHPFVIKPWNKPASTSLSLLTWENASIVRDIYLNSKCGRIALQKKFNSIYNKKLSAKVLHNMIQYFEDDWIPENDPEWVMFREERGKKI